MRIGFFIIMFCCCLLRTSGQEAVQLWAGTKTKANSVTLMPYLASCPFLHSSGCSDTDGCSLAPAVIVCPGGSYCWLDMETEGIEVARWLQANGISAFVLSYRVQGVLPYLSHSRLLFRGHRHPDMINDLQRAIMYVREHADQYGINPHCLGVMGFSAGGHLAMMSAESGSPDFVAAIYPVVSMSHPDSHKRSRRALLGEYKKYSRKMRDSLSVEKHIPMNCPPVFLVACEDDPVVSFTNSELLDSALTAQGISHRYIRYKTGGHGFGVSDSKGTEESRAWKEEFLKWLRQLKIVKL